MSAARGQACQARNSRNPGSGRPRRRCSMAGKFGYSSLLPWPGRGQTWTHAHRPDGPVRPGAEPGRDRPAYDIRTASLGGRPVRTSSGLRVTPDENLREVRLRRPGLLIVPGGEGSRRPDPELTGWLRAHGRQADRLVSVCTGAFLLAEAGL